MKTTKNKIVIDREKDEYILFCKASDTQWAEHFHIYDLGDVLYCKLRMEREILVSQHKIIEAKFNSAVYQIDSIKKMVVASNKNPKVTKNFSSLWHRKTKETQK